MEMDLKSKTTPHIRYRAGYAGLKFCPLSSNGKGEFTKNYFYWEFEAKPTIFSKIYRVLLIWDFQFAAPKVYILNNELHEVELTKRIPHLYCREKIQLCLYYPEYEEFNKYMSLCETIIPWTYRWLQYYEEWLFSGKWKGGDAPHNIVSGNERGASLEQVSHTVKHNKKSITDRIYKQRKEAFELSLQKNVK